MRKERRRLRERERKRKRERDCKVKRSEVKRSEKSCIDVKRNCLDQVAKRKEMESEKIAGIRFAELKTIKLTEMIEMIKLIEMIKT